MSPAVGTSDATPRAASPDAARGSLRTDSAAFLITVRLFARARELAGFDTHEFPLTEPTTCRELLDRLLATAPALAPLAGHLLIAVNGEFRQPDDRLTGPAEVAFFPPVSGG